MSTTAPRILRGLAFFEGGHLMTSVDLDPEPVDLAGFYRDALNDLNRRTDGLVLHSVSLSVEGRKVYFWQSMRGVLITWEAAGPVSGIFSREALIRQPV